MFPFARKQNMNLRPIEQIRFPRKGNMLFTENLTFENYVEFCRQNTVKLRLMMRKEHRAPYSRKRRRF